ncbi:hypothetical protein F4859DRAFT_337555 [Xylaria cf. heliscus]|nr:hypothetical protein F4859DRAFT_337555 [Xylaria cf. heliscus]
MHECTSMPLCARRKRVIVAVPIVASRHRDMAHHLFVSLLPLLQIGRMEALEGGSIAYASGWERWDTAHKRSTQLISSTVWCVVVTWLDGLWRFTRVYDCINVPNHHSEPLACLHGACKGLAPPADQVPKPRETDLSCRKLDTRSSGRRDGPAYLAHCHACAKAS